MRTQLLPHNKVAYSKVMKAFETASRTCVIHPTGTGKSYLMAAVSESYRKVLILGPNTFVLGQVHQVIAWRSDVEYMTYTMLMMKDVIPVGYDLICVDEFHRAGAPEWGDAVDRLLDANPQAKVLGTTATPIRYLDDNRDMADELFGGNIASYMSLKDAWDRNILAMPRFVTGLFDFGKVVADMEERIARSRSIDKAEKKQRLTRISNLRLDWERSQGMPQILRKHIDRDARRIIVFCGNIEHMKDMEKTVREWFGKAGIKVADVYNVHAYMTDSDLKAAMQGFETDDGEGVKLMLSVNMLNEGVHIPRVNAVILLRTTSSKIIYLQQIGRCLTAANTDKPVILDMVDNITTTNLVHDIKEGFDWYEHHGMTDDDEEKEVYEPKDFVVYDYTLGIRQAIEKLVPTDYKKLSYEQRLSLVTEFAEREGRLPMAGDDRQMCMNWQALRASYGDRPEVVALREKYGTVKDFDRRMEKLQRFVDTYDRLPVRKKEHDEYNNYVTLRVRHKNSPDPRMQAILDRYIRKNPTDDELLRQFVDFVNENGSLPRQSVNAPAFEQNLRRHVRERLSEHPTVVELMEKYATVRFVPYEERKSRLKAFVHANDRLPVKADGEDEFRNVQQLRRLNKQNPDEELNGIFEKYSMIKSDDELKRIIIAFYTEHGRLPRKNGTKEESALDKTFRMRKSIHSDPEIAMLLETRRKQVPLKERISILEAYTSEHGKRPDTDDSYMYNMWIRTVTHDKDDPRVKALYDRYGGKPSLRMKEYVAPLADFVHENYRLPLRNAEERKIYSILVNIRKRYADHPDVKPLLDEIASWPSQGCRLRHRNDQEVKELIIAFADKHHRLPLCNASDPEESRLACQWQARRNRLCNDPVVQSISDMYERRKLSFGERYAAVRDWSEEHGKLPTRKDNGDVYQKWCGLTRDYRQTPEVQSLMRKYGYRQTASRIDIDAVMAELHAFADGHGRLPSSSSRDRSEKRLGCRWIRLKHGRYADHPKVTELIERYPIQNRKV